MGLLLALALLWSPVSAQTPSPTPEPSPDAIASLRAELEQVEARLDLFSELGDPDAQEGLADHQASFLDSLRRSQTYLRRQMGLRTAMEQLGLQREELEREMKGLTQSGLPPSQTYDIETLDELRRFKSELSQQIGNQQQALESARMTLELERRVLSERQSSRRRLLDSGPTAIDDAANGLSRERRLESSELAIDASRRATELAQAEIEHASRMVELLERRQDLVRFKIELIVERFVFDEEMLLRQLQPLDEARSLLTEDIRKVQDSIAAARVKLEEVADGEDFELERRARQAWLTTHQRRLSLLEQQLELNLLWRDLWDRRYRVSHGQGFGDWERWLESSRGLLLRLKSSEEALQAELGGIRLDLVALLRLDSASEGPEAGPGSSGEGQWRQLTGQALLARQSALETALHHYGDTALLVERLVLELELQAEDTSWKKRFLSAWRSAMGFWNIELYTIGDSAVTVGKLNVALIVLFLGLALTGRFARLIDRRFLSKLPIRESIRANLERLLRYLLVFLVFLFALHVVNIPLTIFTFLGGTLAIAIGFGTQNILNNFISGLILMMEQPVRVGDLIELDKALGFVEEIGARSTRVRASTGIHIILPNSHLLENRVINWTLTDVQCRTNVTVRAARGSSVEQVLELIDRAVFEVESALKTPAPIVTFDEFSDWALDFTVYFWFHIRQPIDRERVQSAVRVSIARHFRENGIEIPLPQRVLTFPKAVPVEVQGEAPKEPPEQKTEKENGES